MLKASVSKTQQNKIMWSVIKLNTETNCLQHWAHPPSILVTQGWGGEEGGEALVSSEVHHVHTVIQEALQRENKKQNKKQQLLSLCPSAAWSLQKRCKGGRDRNPLPQCNATAGSLPHGHFSSHDRFAGCVCPPKQWHWWACIVQIRTSNVSVVPRVHR